MRERTLDNHARQSYSYGTTDMSESGDSEHNRIFRTHAAYLRAFRRLAFGGEYSSRRSHLPGLAERSLRAYQGNIKRAQNPVDAETLKSCLHRAWGTEAILCATSALAPDADVLQLTLAWDAVQMYYACYGSAQAMLVAEDKKRSEQHRRRPGVPTFSVYVMASLLVSVCAT
jgi:hypothetical protein